MIVVVLVVLLTLACGTKGYYSWSLSLSLPPSLPPCVCVCVCVVEIQAQSITLGSTLLEHILMSLNETKKKLE